MKYMVIHYHCDGLVVSDVQKARLFLTGNVLGLAEVELPNPLLALGGPPYSSRLPWPDKGVTIVLWGFPRNPDNGLGPVAADSKEGAARLSTWMASLERHLGHEPLFADTFTDTLAYCQDSRPMPDGRWRPLE